MGETLSTSALARWRAHPASFIEQVLRDPETGKPFKLLPAERAFLKHAFKTDDEGRLIYPEQIYSCPEEVRQVGLQRDAWCSSPRLLFGGRFAEAYLRRQRP